LADLDPTSTEHRTTAPEIFPKIVFVVPRVGRAIHSRDEVYEWIVEIPAFLKSEK
jgi:hypothetical protein